MKKYIGIDIGTNGGCAILDESGKILDLFKTPEHRLGWIETLSPYTGTQCICILEKVHSQPKNGGKANFSFGSITERTLLSLEICKIPYQEVTPQTWMKTYMLKKEKTESNTQWKNRLKDKAQQLFPNEKMTLWAADTILIAEFARRYYK